jgi:hypothetical protein
MKQDRAYRPATARACVQGQRFSWPQGGVAGLLLVASACIGFSLMLYHVAGPRDVFAEEMAAD